MLIKDLVMNLIQTHRRYNIAVDRIDMKKIKSSVNDLIRTSKCLSIHNGWWCELRANFRQRIDHAVIVLISTKTLFIKSFLFELCLHSLNVVNCLPHFDSSSINFVCFFFLLLNLIFVKQIHSICCSFVCLFVFIYSFYN